MWMEEGDMLRSTARMLFEIICSRSRTAGHAEAVEIFATCSRQLMRPALHKDSEVPTGVAERMKVVICRTSICIHSYGIIWITRPMQILYKSNEVQSVI